MTEAQIRHTVIDAINSVPFAKGANNHMGSLLTQLDDPMLWIMEILKQKQLYFVDSMTTRFTKAGDKADQLGVPLLKRQLFLDNDTSANALEKQFSSMITQAHAEGNLVAIAHPYPETIHFLRANLQRLKIEGIDLVPASSLLFINISPADGANPTVTLRWTNLATELVTHYDYSQYPTDYIDRAHSNRQQPLGPTHLSAYMLA
ncbi:Divergent polysaccharide deacetylase [Shewanella morhuae]|uniref:Divergent polysaccharide deacetylase n=1 Tax=Shewanella morhuae TaxID=365591 RepID=A0A380AYY0_9GAMM|nr:Divergent polysaccharide deacetylase [Shewanella morhuae]